MEMPKNFSNIYIWIKTKAWFALSSLFPNWKSVRTFREMDPCASHLGVPTSSKYGWNESVDAQTLAIILSFLSKKGSLSYGTSKEGIACCVFSLGTQWATQDKRLLPLGFNQTSSKHGFHFPHQTLACQVKPQHPAIQTRHISFKKARESQPKSPTFPQPPTLVTSTSSFSLPQNGLQRLMSYL